MPEGGPFHSKAKNPNPNLLPSATEKQSILMKTAQSNMAGPRTAPVAPVATPPPASNCASSPLDLDSSQESAPVKETLDVPLTFEGTTRGLSDD